MKRESGAEGARSVGSQDVLARGSGGDRAQMSSRDRELRYNTNEGSMVELRGRWGQRIESR